MTKPNFPPKGYTALQDEALLKRNTKNQEWRRKSGNSPLRPSSAGYCARRLAYDIDAQVNNKDYPHEEMEPNRIRILNFGHSVEFSAIKNFREVEGLQVKYGQQILDMFTIPTKKGPLRISGQCDGVFLFEEKGYKGVMDVKSQGDGWSKAYRSRWDETLEKLGQAETVEKLTDISFYIDDLEAFNKEFHGDFLTDNLIQLNMYACAPFIKDRGIDHGIIYKYNKNSSKHYELIFRPSEKVYEQIKEKFTKVQAAGEAGKPEIIEKPYNLGTMRCSFCPYREMCWPESDAKKEYWKTQPKKSWPKDTKYLGKAYSTFEAMFKEYEEINAAMPANEKRADRILLLMEKLDIRKIKLDNGHVYERKFLKSPKPHYELRRTKL